MEAWLTQAVGAITYITAQSTMLWMAGALLQTAASGWLSNRSDNVICRGAKRFNEKLKTDNSPENHDLAKAFRRSYIKGMQYTCNHLKPGLGLDTAAPFFSFPRGIILGSTPVSNFAEDERQWLDKAETYLRNKIKELDDNQFVLPKRSNQAFNDLIGQDELLNSGKVNQFRNSLTEEAIAELQNEIGNPPESFIKKMHQSWFEEVCNTFQEAIASNQLLANKFQNQTLVEIKSDTSEMKITLGEVLELLRGIAGEKKQQKSLSVSNLPNLNETVYDRETESKELLDALLNDKERFFLIVAPAGFGKTFLLTKVLQEVVSDQQVNPTFVDKIKRIIRLDCNLTGTLPKIVNEFNNLFDENFEYKPEREQTAKEWVEVNLFRAVNEIGTTWLILENFEDWLDPADNYKVKEAELRAFVHALLDGRHTLRVLIFSQAEPDKDLTAALTKLKLISDSIAQGLPEEDALRFLKTEGKTVSLDKVDEHLLKDFLDKVCCIPQALSSLIGFLKTVQTEWEMRGRTFADFMADEKMWTDFDEYENNHIQESASEQYNALRRTKALIARQISNQPQEIKLLLQALAFFNQPLALQVLEVLVDDGVDRFEQIRRLVDHRLVRMQKRANGVVQLELHTYFQDQARNPKVLPLFELIDPIRMQEYAFYLNDLGAEAIDKSDFQLATEFCYCAVKIFECLVKNGHKTLEDNLAGAYLNKSIAFTRLGKLSEALAEQEKSLRIFERLVEVEKSDNPLLWLALVYLNRGNVLQSSGNLPESIVEYDKSITISRQFDVAEKGNGLLHPLPAAYMGKGVALQLLGELSQSIAEYDKSIKIYEYFINGGKLDPMSEGLARVFLNKGNALIKLPKASEAIIEHNKSIAIYEQLVNEEKRSELLSELAAAYLNKGFALKQQRDFEDALISYGQSIGAYSTCLEKLNQMEVLPKLMQSIASRFEVLIELKIWDKVETDVLTANRLFNEYSEHPELSELFKTQTFENFAGIIQTFLEEKAKHPEEIQLSLEISDEI